MLCLSLEIDKNLSAVALVLHEGRDTKTVSGVLASLAWTESEPGSYLVAWVLGRLADMPPRLEKALNGLIVRLQNTPHTRHARIPLSE